MTGPYRYTLRRTVAVDSDPDRKRLTAICLNPSTAWETNTAADPAGDDMTVRKLYGFCRHADWRFSSFRLVNLFPFRATDPAELLAASPEQRLGDQLEANAAIFKAVRRAEVVLVAWGGHGAHPEIVPRVAAVHQLIQRALWQLDSVRVVCLGITSNGQPRHPSRRGYDTNLQPWGM